MNPRRGLGLLWALVTLTIVGAVAYFAYQAGLSTAIVSSGHDPAVVQGAYPGYYYYGHAGFGFFPFLLFILLLLFLFRGGRRWHRPWGYGPGWGHGGGPWQGQGNPGSPMGPDVPPAIEERLRAWHEKAHGEGAPTGAAETPAKPD